MQSSWSYFGNVAYIGRTRESSSPVTEPSGHGDYAEAMRELIAELRPFARGATLAAANVAEPGPLRFVRRGHLRLVR